MENLLAPLIFKNKSKIKGWLLAYISLILLSIIRVPKPIKTDVFQLFVNLDFLNGLQATMWFINRSFLKVNALALNFRVGDVLSLNTCRILYDSNFLSQGENYHIDKGWLIISALIKNPTNSFWLECYRSEFLYFKDKIPLLLAGKKNVTYTPKKFVKESYALQALDDLSLLFKNLNTRFFLVSGTFLGLIREKKFLGHDYDIDVGCFEWELNFEQFLQALNNDNNFYLKELCYFVNDESNGQPDQVNRISVSPHPYTVKLLHKNYISIDIFIHFKKGNDLIHGTGIHLWHNQEFSLVPYTFYSKTVLGADNYDQYLSENYGEWKLENKDFDCDLDTPNLEFPDTPQAYLYLRQHFKNHKAAL